MQWNFVSLFLHLRRNGTAQFVHTRLIPWLTIPFIRSSSCSKTAAAIVTYSTANQWVWYWQPSSWRLWHATWWQQLGWWHSWWRWRFWSWSPLKRLTSTANVTTRSVCLSWSVCFWLSPLWSLSPHSLTAVAWMCMYHIKLKTCRYQRVPLCLQPWNSQVKLTLMTQIWLFMCVMQ